MSIQSNEFQQIKIGLENGYANLDESETGHPNIAGVTMNGVCVANPMVDINYETAVNETTRNRAYKHAPVMLLSRGQLTCEVYTRGNGSPEGAMSDPTYHLLGQYFSGKVDLLREDTVASFATTSTLTVSDAYENGWRVGMGFYIQMPGRKQFSACIKALSNVDTPGADTITFDPPMTASELARAQAASSLKIRGGRTYWQAEGYGAADSLAVLGIKRNHATLLHGVRGNTFEAQFETGQPGKFMLDLTAAGGHQGGIVPATTVVEWTDPTNLEVAADAGATLKVGMFASVTVDGTAYPVVIKAINGDLIEIEDAGLPSDIDEKNPVPSLAPLRPGATTEPVGQWLVYLNGRATVAGEAKHVRNMVWNVNMQPQMPPTPWNGVGTIDMISTFPEITVTMEESDFNDAALNDFRSGTKVSVLSMLGDGTVGDIVFLYAPAMHYKEVPKAGATDNLITMPLTFETSLYTGDTGDYDFGLTAADTPLRLFIGW